MTVGRFGKQDFVYLPDEDAYRCPAGEQLPYRFTSEEDGKRLRRYWTTACQDCALKSQCTTGSERRIPRWLRTPHLKTGRSIALLCWLVLSAAATYRGE